MEIIKKEKVQTLTVRTFTSMEKISEAMGAAFGETAGLIAQSDTDFAGPPFAAYYNMDMENLDIEMGFPVTKPLTPSGRARMSALPEAETATDLYIGPYDGIGDAYARLNEFVQQQGREADTYCWEEYLNDPAEVAPEQLKTRIYIPLK